MTSTLTTPITYDREVSPASVGMSDASVRRIMATFEGQLARGLHPGAQMVVLRHGQVVVDRAAGIANLVRRTRVTPETPFLTWSCTKAFTGMCIHKLIEEGRIEWDAPIAAYWPEFGCNGKGPATIRHVFLHQAGIPMRGTYTQYLLWPNWEKVTRHVAQLAAEYPPGAKSIYHAMNYGFIFGEVVRRVTGQPIQDYLRQNFLEPLGLRNTWLGLPRSRWLVAAGIYTTARAQILPTLAFFRRAVRCAPLPAATLHSNAREIAIFYQMLLNGGLYAGRRYLRPETVAAATALGYEGPDAALGLWARWAHGFHLGGLQPRNPVPDSEMGKGSTVRTFGHFGQATCMAWADPDANIVVVFLCNRLLDEVGVPVRWRELSDAVWDALT
jgi:CubicO group peptidase (beta-lactamase class C family)